MGDHLPTHPPAHTPHPAHADDWSAYFDAVAGLPPRETLLLALERFGGTGKQSSACPWNTNTDHGQAQSSLPVPPLALDLGCGDGRDTLELLRRHWRVLAIDSSPEALARLTSRLSNPQSEIRNPQFLELRLAPFQSTPRPPCDLVNASFSIPHCSPADFPAMWSRIVAALRPGGRFAGQLFGVRDQWATKPDGVTRTYHTREQVESLLAPFDIEHLDEVERHGKNALGEPKYWHVFHIVARKV